VIVGLGYNKEKNQFKALRISFNCKIVPEPPALIEVHTLGIGDWRMIGGRENFADVLHNPSCVNGRIYFLVASEGAVGHLNLFSFDLNTESLQQVIWPEQQNFYLAKTRIGNINGSLYTIKVEWQNVFIGLGSDLQAWRLNDEAWDALFNVTIPNGFSAYNCPFLFTVPRPESSYMIYYDNNNNNNNQIFIYSGPGIG
jgi:F-box interacting protein